MYSVCRLCVSEVEWFGVGGEGGRSSLYVVRCTIPWFCIMSGGPCDAAARRAGGKRRGEGSLSLCTHRIYFSHRTSYWREGTRGGARVRERESECARVSRVCAWIAPPHPVHRFCRRPCSDGENHADKPFFSLRFIRHHGIPDVTDRSFMSPALSPAPFISERL